jgi:hypothetical protein
VTVIYFKVQSCIFFGGSEENGENLGSQRPIHSTHKQNMSHWQFYSSNWILTVWYRISTVKLNNIQLHTKRYYNMKLIHYKWKIQDYTLYNTTSWCFLTTTSPSALVISELHIFTSHWLGGAWDLGFFSTTFKSTGHTTSIYSLVMLRHYQCPQFTNQNRVWSKVFQTSLYTRQNKDWYKRQVQLRNS